MKPYFSIIIPAYNRAHILKECINSVLNQTIDSWELIVVDDGSTDNTLDVVKQFTDPRIIYQYQTNQERSAARNNGVKISKGKYICFLDSDDFYCENHLESFNNFITKNNEPVALLFNNCYKYNDGKKEKMNVNPFTPDNTLKYILESFIIPGCVCIHRDIFNTYQYDKNIKIVEDTVLWAQITNDFKMYHVNEYTILYHVHDDNSVNKKYNAFRTRLDGLRILFKQDKIKKRLSRELKNNVISVCYYGIARHFEYKRNYFNMVYNLFLSILYNPKSPQTKAKIYTMYSYFKKDLR